MIFQQPDFNKLFKYNKKRYLSVMFFVLLAMGLIFGTTKFGVGSHEIAINNSDEATLWQKVAGLFDANKENLPTIDDDPDYVMPKEEKDRWDILIMGIRGEEQKDDEVGAMLTDTMMVLSYDSQTKKTSLVSIPRDLFVRIYGTKKDKINSAYEIGLLRKNGLGFTKKLVSRITGVYIDNVIVIDFSSFKKIIDDLGGVDVVLDKPFQETQQWGYEFSLPAGPNHLDGQNALYYARSRFSSSDFDRASRQQKIIMAIKDKVLSLNLLTDPIRSLSILNSIRKNIQTDLYVWDAGSLVELSGQFDSESKIKRYVITTENLVYESHMQTDIGNLYVLLPNGDNLQGIKQMFRDILN